MAMPPPELTCLGVFKGMTIKCYNTSVWDGQLADLNHKQRSLLTCALNAMVFLIILDMFELTFWTFMIIYLFRCKY